MFKIGWGLFGCSFDWFDECMVVCVCEIFGFDALLMVDVGVSDGFWLYGYKWVLWMVVMLVVYGVEWFEELFLVDSFEDYVDLRC